MEKKAIQKRKAVNFPAPPSDWNMLSEQQLRTIHELMESGIGVSEYKLKVFLMLMGLRIVKRADKKEDGSFVYHFRRTGWKSRFSREEFGMEAWEVDYWIEKYLKFLDEPFRLIQLPFSHVRVGMVRYKAPDPLMVNLTYEQYGNAQRCLIAYWETSRMVESLKKNGATLEAVKHAQEEALQARAGFLAHMYVEPGWQLLDQRNQMTRISIKRVYEYCSVKAEERVEDFKAAPSWLFAVTYQLFQSCLSQYKQKFPYIFKQCDDNDGKDVLIIELGTLNAIQKYGGFTETQKVYDQNSMIIFKFLDSMAEEAKQIEDMNRKMKLKN